MNARPSPGAKWPHRLIQLQTKIDTRGALLSREWDEYEYLLRRNDPAAHKRKNQEGHRRHCIKLARELSLADLTELVKEKQRESRSL